MNLPTWLRLSEAVFGEAVEPPLVPVLIVTLLSTAAFSTLWSYIGIWAVTRLDAGPTAIGFMYALDATVAAVSGYLGGRLSDRVGRRAMMVAGWGFEAVAALALSIVGKDLYLGIVLVCLAGAASGPAQAGANAVVADLVSPERSESAYAIVRTVANIGSFAGPPLGALVLVGTHWTALFLLVASAGLAAAAAALSLLPATSSRPIPSERKGHPHPSFYGMAHDKLFMLLLFSNFLGFVVYVAYEVLLPITAVTSYGMSPSTWGVLAALDPLLIIVLQTRTSRAAHRIPRAPRLGLSMLLMGVPFLLLLVSGSVPVVTLVVVLFALGEMVWAPTSQALAANAAPVGVRGAYMGAFGASTSAAWAVGPIVGLSLRNARSNGAVWAFTASAAMVGAIAGVLACRLLPHDAGDQRVLAKMPSFSAHDHD